MAWIKLLLKTHFQLFATRVQEKNWILLNLLVRTSSNFVNSLAFSLHTTMSFANGASSFTSLHFPHFCAFYFLYWFVRMPTNSQYYVRSCENWHLCVDPNFRGKEFSHCLLHMMLNIGLSGLTSFPTISWCGEYFFYFYHQWLLNFVQCFFSTRGKVHMCFLLYSVDSELY